MKRILICEDEDTIREFVVINLKRAGYDVVDVNCGEAALKTFETEHGNFDIVLLDIMMPGIDGFTVCKKIREKSSTIGIIMLTARTQEMDKVSGLMIGADDYITKPFSNAILVARVKAALRRTAPPTGPVRALGSLVLDETTRTASVDGVMLSLTRSEFDLLDILSAHPGRVYTRQQIIVRIQREEKDVTDRTVDTLMVGLRRKLGEWAGHVETIRGIGYRITP